MQNSLDAVIFRLSSHPPFNIYYVGDDGMPRPWFEVKPGILWELAIQQIGLATQVEAIGAQIMFWGRMVAQAKRVWDVEQRLYRVWRDKRYLDLLGEKEKGKKLTQANLDRLIRSEAVYTEFYRRIERAEEAYNAAGAVLEGFRAKKDLMKTAIIRQHEDGAPRLSV
jgi:hypothetical protein